MTYKEIKTFIYTIRFPLYLVLSLWLIEIIDRVFHLELRHLGIYPRDWKTIGGIFTSPFIHSTWDHLIANSSPLFVLTTIMTIFYPRATKSAFFFITFGTGFLVWLFARPSYHIGASGVVYGLASFIAWSGIFKKNIKSIILSLIVIILYSGMATGLFPGDKPHISWESHLGGAMVGMVIAFIFRSIVEDHEVEELPSWYGEDDTQYFLPRDTFEKTKWQRYQEQIQYIYSTNTSTDDYNAPT